MAAACLLASGCATSGGPDNTVPQVELDFQDIIPVRLALEEALKGQDGEALLLGLSTSAWAVRCELPSTPGKPGEPPDPSLAEAIGQLCHRSQTPRSLDAIALPGSILRVAPGITLDSISTSRPRRSARSFRHRYPGVTSIVEVTVPGYDKARSRAAIMITVWDPLRWDCNLHGTTHLFLLDRRSGDWQLQIVYQPEARTRGPGFCP